MKIAWASDVHVNFVTLKQFNEFVNSLKGCDKLIISGDIAEAGSNIGYLSLLQSAIPTYYVLGNHDFYNGSIEQEKARHSEYVNYLGGDQVICIDDTCIIGVDSFADGRAGDYENSNIVLNDHLYIKEFSQCITERRLYSVKFDRTKLLKRMQKYADRDTRDLKRKVLKAIKSGYTEIFIVTHVPMFECVTRYQCLPTSKEFLPFYCSYRMGQEMLNIFKKYPHVNFTLLAGHTHEKTTLQLRDNVRLYVAGAEYRYPAIAKVFEI